MNDVQHAEPVRGRESEPNVTARLEVENGERKHDGYGTRSSFVSG